MKKFLYATFTLFTLVSFSQVDRTRIPESGPTPEINLGEPINYQLKNGMKLILVKMINFHEYFLTYLLTDSLCLKVRKLEFQQ